MPDLGRGVGHPAFDEVRNEERNILPPLARRGNAQADQIEPEIEVVLECLVPGISPSIASKTGFSAVMAPWGAGIAPGQPARSPTASVHYRERELCLISVCHQNGKSLCEIFRRGAQGP
jgi:hypothetical protein